MLSSNPTKGRGRQSTGKHLIVAQRGEIVAWLIRLLVWMFAFGLAATSLTGCGQPRVAIRDQVVSPKPVEPYVPADYIVGYGDQLEILYQIDPGRDVTEYVIDSEDRLRVDFFYYPIMSRSVRVRPDGYITLPKIGDVKAAGLKPTSLAAELSRLYAPHLSRPNITVEVTGFNAKLDELKRAITTQDRGQSRLVVVRPDGKISLPYIDDAPAAGLTAQQMSDVLEQKYQKIVSSISITVAVLRARSNRVYVMGQVKRPNFYELLGPTTVSRIIAEAGGFDNQANSRQVVVISRTKDGRPEARVLDLGAVIGQGRADQDRLLRQYDVVYVPHTTLGAAALTADALWRLIPLRFTGSAGYTLSQAVGN